MFEEKAKEILKSLLRDQTIDENDLESFGFTESEIKDIAADRRWQYIYENVDFSKAKEQLGIIRKALGISWKSSYDYKESSKDGRYVLMIRLSGEDFEAIMKAAGLKSDTL